MAFRAELLLIFGTTFFVGSIALVTNAPRGYSAERQPSEPISPSIERGRTLYVMNMCSQCHGLAVQTSSKGDISLPNYFPHGSRHDLLHSPVVGSDNDGDMLWVFVHNGVPAAQVPMPRFPDLTRADVSDIAAFVHEQHYEVRDKELISMPISAGDAAMGESFFTGNGKCASCHDQSWRVHLNKYDALTLKEKIVQPQFTNASAQDVGQIAHKKLVEQYTDEQVQNLVAYLKQ